MQKYPAAAADERALAYDEAGQFAIAVGRILERASQERFARYGLTISDAAPLMTLVEFGPMTPTELLESSILLTSAPVVSHSINRLEQAGLVRRRSHEHDGRKRVIVATEAGREAAGLIRQEIDGLVADFFAPLLPDEVAQLRALLLRCLEPRTDTSSIAMMDSS